MKSVKAKISIAIIISIAIACVSPAHAFAPSSTSVVKLKIVLQKPKEYAKIKMLSYGWRTERQYLCLQELWTKESHWNNKADNPKSTAFGIAQMLNETATNPVTQIDNGLRYIEHRYGLPCTAWKHWQRHYWY